LVKNINIIEKCTVCIFILLALGCSAPKETQPHVALGNKFIDSFYSFNRDSLQALLAAAEQSQPEILYYQKWAECAHYKVLDRSRFRELNDSLVIFPVTVEDDLMKSLAINFNVTDTFHISFRHGAISSVKTSSNDLPEYYQAKEWVNTNRPELVKEACEGIWEGGPTPCECVQGMIQGFTELTALKESE
jgi:hypothetical protein